MLIALARLLLLGLVLVTVGVGQPRPALAFDVGGLIGGVMQGAIQADQQRQLFERQQQMERQQRLLQQYQRQQQIDQEQQQEFLRRQVTAQPPAGTDPQADWRTAPVSNGARIAFYKVDGHVLGQALPVETLGGEFRCHPSEQFPGFQWCRERRQFNGVWTNTSIILSSTNAVAYDSKFYESAQFLSGAVASEIERLSGLHHERARVLRMPGASRDDDAVIATWGALTLVQLDSATANTLAGGGSISAGVLIDFLNNARESAKRGLPVYRLAGGPGYYWIARFGRTGAGNLRFGIANAQAFDGPKEAPQVAVAPAPAVAPPSARAPRPARPSGGRHGPKPAAGPPTPGPGEEAGERDAPDGDGRDGARLHHLPRSAGRRPVAGEPRPGPPGCPRDRQLGLCECPPSRKSQARRRRGG